MKELIFKVIFECKYEETKEVQERLSNLIIKYIKKMEGLLTDGFNPFKKSYYFSVKEVKLVTNK